MKREQTELLFLSTKHWTWRNQALWGVRFTAREFVVMTRKFKWATKYDFWFHSRSGDFYKLFLWSRCANRTHSPEDKDERVGGSLCLCTWCGYMSWSKCMWFHIMGICHVWTIGHVYTVWGFISQLILVTCDHHEAEVKRTQLKSNSYMYTPHVSWWYSGMVSKSWKGQSHVADKGQDTMLKNQ